MAFDEDIQEWDLLVFFDFHGKFDIEWLYWGQG